MFINIIRYIQQETSKIVLLIIIMFILSISFSTLITNFRINKEIKEITNQITILKESYSVFTNYYSSINLPASEVSNMIILLNTYSNIINHIDQLSEKVTLVKKINIKSLIVLYKQKTNSLLKIATDFNSAINPVNKGEQILSKSEQVDLLLSIEKFKISYINSNNDTYLKKRIDFLRDIKYNLDNTILNKKANKDLVNFVGYFSTYHIAFENIIDKSIKEKEKELLN
jgi:hypothetical protein